MFKLGRYPPKKSSRATISVLRPSVHSLGVMEGNQVSTCRGEEYVINRAMYLCNLRFSWREMAQDVAWPSRRVQKLDFKYFKHKDL